VGPEFEKGDGRLRPSLQQRLPGAEGPPEGCSTAPRHAACGGPVRRRNTEELYRSLETHTIASYITTATKSDTSR